MKEFVKKIEEHDVLLGRGTGPNDRPGNVAYRTMIKDNFEEYQRATQRGGKTAIARRVVRCILSKKGRFLRRLTADELAEASSKGVPTSRQRSTSVESEDQGKSVAESASSEEDHGHLQDEEELVELTPCEITDLFIVEANENSLVQKTKQAFRHIIRQTTPRKHSRHKASIYNTTPPAAVAAVFTASVAGSINVNSVATARIDFHAARASRLRTDGGTDADLLKERVRQQNQLLLHGQLQSQQEMGDHTTLTQQASALFQRSTTSSTLTPAPLLAATHPRKSSFIRKSASGMHGHEQTPSAEAERIALFARMHSFGQHQVPERQRHIFPSPLQQLAGGHSSTRSAFPSVNHNPLRYSVASSMFHASSLHSLPRFGSSVDTAAAATAAVSPSTTAASRPSASFPIVYTAARNADAGVSLSQVTQSVQDVLGIVDRTNTHPNGHIFTRGGKPRSSQPSLGQAASVDSEDGLHGRTTVGLLRKTQPKSQPTRQQPMIMQTSQANILQTYTDQSLIIRSENAGLRRMQQTSASARLSRKQLLELLTAERLALHRGSFP